MEDDVLKQKLPHHVAIVMDGNGRWAQNRGLPRVNGHRAGSEAVKSMVQCCLKKGIKVLSLFAFSSENWLRPAMEVEFLMNLFIHLLERELQPLHEHGVCLKFLGERAQLSSDLQVWMNKAETLTHNNNELILNIAVNYSGKWDVIQATKAIAQQVAEGIMQKSDINEASFAKFLSTGDLPDPDLLIRTSGEKRISNFFLWQLAYTELYFSDTQWPDFTQDEFEQALAAFNLRERRYGQLSTQLHEYNYGVY